MSHASGQVKFPDGKLFHFEYNGTVDQCYPLLFETFEELEENWRKQPSSVYLFDCPHTAEEIKIASSYGKGFSWNGEGCKICKRIVGIMRPQYDNNYSDGLPDWYEK